MYHQRLSKILHKAFRYLISVFCIACLIWGFLIEPGSLRVTEHSLNLPNWSRTCKPLRIAILSDLHIGSPLNDLAHLGKIVEETNRAQADLILLPGDFINHELGGDPASPEEIAAQLHHLHAPLGVYAVLGNHDWWQNAARVEQSLQAQGIIVLEDKNILLQHQNCTFNLVGVSDFWEGPHNIKSALKNINNDSPTLLFTHNPDIFPLVPNSVTLTIAGHTHGGQVYLPLIGRPVIPSNYGQRYAIGHIEEENRHMFVSSGIGTSILPIRFLVPPEITLLVLQTP